MKEILFRGKDTETGEWVYGSLINRCFGNFEIINGCAYSDVRYEVKPETVGQYTGVDDINGNKVFEGDVVRISSRPDLTNNQIKRGFLHHNKKGLATFDKGRWVAKRQPNKGSCYNIWLYEYDYDFAIIGNIHDNPELLEEE